MPAKVDVAGVACNAVCAVHCAAASLSPSTLGFLGLGVLVGPTLEGGFAVAALVFARFALRFGFRQHRALGVAALFLVGMLGLIGGRVLEESVPSSDLRRPSWLACFW